MSINKCLFQMKFTDNDNIETERLILRPVTPEVYKSIISSNTDEEIKAFFGFTADEELTAEKEKFSKGLTTFNKSFLYFQLLDKNLKKLVGWCGYHSWYFIHYRAEIGYGLYEDIYKRKGLMKEALKPIIRYGFEAMQLNRIEAYIGPDNAASLQLAERIGFTREALLKEHYYTNGIIEDSVMYALLKKDYQPLNK